MKTNRLCIVLLALAVLLCGCGAVDEMAEKTGMLQVLRDLMDCVEKADVDRAADMFENREQFRELFPQLAAYWQPTAEDEIEVMSLNSTSTGSGEKRETISVGTFLVHSQDGDYQVYLAVHADSGGSLIRGFNVMDVKELPTAEQTEQAPEWLTWSVWGLMLAFCAFTIIDCVRKKPKRYGWLIALALVFISFIFTGSPAGRSFTFHIGILSQSGWQAWPNGTRITQVSLPLGAISYWIARRKLLEKKTEEKAEEQKAEAAE